MASVRPENMVKLFLSLLFIYLPLAQADEALQQEVLQSQEICEMYFSGANFLEIGSLTIWHNGATFWKKKKIPLKRSHWRVLIEIVTRKNEYVNAAQIIKAVWGESESPKRIKQVVSAVSLIRSAFVKIDPDFSQIKSIYNLGYIWIPESELDFIKMGDLEIHPELKELKWKRKKVELSSDQFDVLELLLRKPGTWVTTSKLVLFMDNRRRTLELRDDTRRRYSVFYIISKIRKAFRSVDPNFDCIEVDSGVGYRWVPQETTGTDRAKYPETGS